MTEYTRILSSEEFPYYSATELIDNETAKNIDTIKFKSPLLFTYSNTDDVNKLVSALEHFREHISYSYSIKSNTPQKLLIELSDVMYSKRIINNNKRNNITFPRDRIEAYSILYSVVGTEEYQGKDEIVLELNKVINNIKGANRVDIYCYPKSLLNKNKWKNFYGADYNAKIIAYFTGSIETVEEADNGNSINNNNNNNKLKKATISTAGGSLIGAVSCILICLIGYIINENTNNSSSSEDEEYKSKKNFFSSNWITIMFVGIILGGLAGLLYGMISGRRNNEVGETQRRIRNDRYWEQKRI